MYDIPLSIITDRINIQNTLELLAFQGVWVAVLVLMIRVVVKYFQKLLVVAGG